MYTLYALQTCVAWIYTLNKQRFVAFSLIDITKITLYFNTVNITIHNINTVFDSVTIWIFDEITMICRSAVFEIITRFVFWGCPRTICFLFVSLSLTIHYAYRQFASSRAQLVSLPLVYQSEFHLWSTT